MRRTWILLVTALLLSISPLSAADNTVIKRGIDVFTTTANGKTFYNFAKNPIPAGFFCQGSKAYTGRMVLRGLPLETEIPGQLKGTDTVVERLDDAVFDRNGVATTRVRFRALSLVSLRPLRTSCGAYHVYLTLAGEQRETTMRIYRTYERGGNFQAPLAVNARMTFVPVKGQSPHKLELTANITFPTTPIPWSLPEGTRMKQIGSLVVDTNGDLKPDTRLPGTSNFAAGWSPKLLTANYGGGSCSVCEPETCHDNDGEQHCSGPIYACYPYNCN